MLRNIQTVLEDVDGIAVGLNVKIAPPELMETTLARSAWVEVREPTLCLRMGLPLVPWRIPMLLFHTRPLPPRARLPPHSSLRLQRCPPAMPLLHVRRQQRSRRRAAACGTRHTLELAKPKQAGNAMVAAGDWAAAIEQYTKALGALPDLALLQSCLQNCAIGRKAIPALALSCGSAAVRLAPSEKGSRLCANALQALKPTRPGLDAMLWVAHPQVAAQLDGGSPWSAKCLLRAPSASVGCILHRYLPRHPKYHGPRLSKNLLCTIGKISTTCLQVL